MSKSLEQAIELSNSLTALREQRSAVMSHFSSLSIDIERLTTQCPCIVIAHFGDHIICRTCWRLVYKGDPPTGYREALPSEVEDWVKQFGLDSAKLFVKEGAEP